MCRRSSVNEKRGSNAREQSERSVKKENGSSVKKKRGRDVRWRRVSVGEKKESAAKQSNELMCQCVRVTALSFIYIECVHRVSKTVIYAYAENKYSIYISSTLIFVRFSGFPLELHASSSRCSQ